MSIPDTYEFDNSGEVVRRPAIKRYFLALVIILLATLSFGLGRLSSSGTKPPVKIEYEPINDSQGVSATQSASVTASVPSRLGSVYASSKGTRYYYSNCKSPVSEKNKIFFSTTLEAEKAGYTLAANCKP
ncbi:hypothetical protein KW790_00665 [Candidatus Parcubacteria bacterium]|nr:hypothetical protein [Candidatus Parcubacteria bacterium]